MGSDASSPGFSASGNGNSGDFGGSLCYTNTKGSMTGCVNGSTANGGTGGLSFTYRFG